MASRYTPAIYVTNNARELSIQVIREFEALKKVLNGLMNIGPLWATIDLTAGNGRAESDHALTVTEAGRKAGLVQDRFRWSSSTGVRLDTPRVMPIGVWGYNIQVWSRDGATQPDDIYINQAPEHYGNVDLKTDGDPRDVINFSRAESGSGQPDEMRFIKGSNARPTFPALQIRIYPLGLIFAENGD